jgi:hypothetical protein
MKLFHSSSQIVTKPDVYHSREFLDFGKGFYLTTIEEQALAYAKKFTTRSRTAYLNIYEFDESQCEQWQILKFQSYDEEWLDFVMDCRSGNDGSSWDLVVGGIANDRVFRTVDLYFSGDISKVEALGRLKFEHPNNQICIRAQRVIDNALAFVASREVC